MFLPFFLGGISTENYSLGTTEFCVFEVLFLPPSLILSPVNRLFKAPKKT